MSRGRHRLARPSARRVAAATALAVAAGTTFALWPAPADAVAPVQSAWWNVSGAPAPTAPSGGLHISVAPGGPSGTGQVLAFGAVLYKVPAGATGTLELKVSGEGVPNPNPDYPDQASQPNINLAGCPTTEPWKAGGNQAGPGPKYDCSHEINGNMSADGKTVTFFVDTNGQTGDGTLSLAIVPVMNDTVPVVRTEVPGMDMTEPFSVDVAKPAADSLVVTGSVPGTPDSGGKQVGAPPTPTGTTSAAGNSSANGASGGTSSGAGSSPVDLSMPAATTTTPSDSGTAPVVANQTPAAAPAAAIRPAATDSTRRDAALALLILLAAAVLLTNQRNARMPRAALAAALASTATPAGAGGEAAAAPTLDAATLALLAGYGSRGLGRFAKPRTDGPRPLV